MDRRTFLVASASLATTSSFPSQARAAVKALKPTYWKVTTSPGLDAVLFLDALSGTPLYADLYGDDLASFAPSLSVEVRDDVPRLWEEARKAGFGLLGPSVANILSGSGDGDLQWTIDLIEQLDARVRPVYMASSYWNEDDWRWLTSVAPRMARVFKAVRGAGFARFHAERTRAYAGRAAELERDLKPYNVIGWQEKLTGRTFDPTIEIVLLYFILPHGAKLQGQRFVQSANFSTATTVRIAAHEMLHLPIRMDGPVAHAMIATLGDDPLFVRIVREHDSKWGYATVDGLFNEDCCQALDQLISEKLGVGRNPADRWRDGDDGIHVLAAALYGMLRQDRWLDRGGDFEGWLACRLAAGAFAPSVFHATAAVVLERPVDRLWPLSFSRASAAPRLSRQA